MWRTFLGILAALFMVAGLLGIGLGILYAIVYPWWWERSASQAAQLPLVNATGLKDTAVGRRVLVEGSIGPKNPGQTFETDFFGPKSYIIYQLIEFVSSPPDSNGVVNVEQTSLPAVTPAFRLDLPDGQVEIGNSDYKYVFPLPNGGKDNQGRRVNGFIVGDHALVDGTVVQQDGAPALRAGMVHPGPRDAYIDYLRGPADTRGLSVPLGAMLACAGTPFLALGLLLTWRLRRRASHPGF